MNIVCILFDCKLRQFCISFVNHMKGIIIPMTYDKLINIEYKYI